MIVRKDVFDYDFVGKSKGYPIKVEIKVVFPELVSP